MAVPVATETRWTRFSEENVSAASTYDPWGRLSLIEGSSDEAAGGVPGAPPKVKLDYYDDQWGNKGGGFLGKVTRGDSEAQHQWQRYTYDDMHNIERITTSWGATSVALHDEWGRPIRTLSGGKAEGSADTEETSSDWFQAVASNPCEGWQGESGWPEAGALSERAYDAAGHLVRERMCQDYIDDQGELAWRWVQAEYRYNARDQVYKILRSHVASPETPGGLEANVEGFDGLIATTEVIYDDAGRVSETRALSHESGEPPLITKYRYDRAGRIAEIINGNEIQVGAEHFGYDENGRLVFHADGDAEGQRSVLKRSFDAWDRPHAEELPTGAFIERMLDKADNVTGVIVYDSDPADNELAKVLSRVQTHFNSLGKPGIVVEHLGLDDDGHYQVRITKREYDSNGRTVLIRSGPNAFPLTEPLASAEDYQLDEELARREVQIEYEEVSGRVLSQRFGGHGTYSAPEEEYRIEYHYANQASDRNMAPWPDRVTTFEHHPADDPGTLVQTVSTYFTRDVFGRPIEVSRLADVDGSDLISLGRSTYDRMGGVIRTESGAGTVTSNVFDSRGYLLRELRPDGRGSTSYSYDYDGRLLKEAVQERTASGGWRTLWETSYEYDESGRVNQIIHPDETTESFSYYPDDTLEWHLTRDGVKVTYNYDNANRLISAVPELDAGTTQPPSLIDLDDGTFYEYDKASRITEINQGITPQGAADPAIRYQEHDLAGRPAKELLGERNPLIRGYDVWDRTTHLSLPEGLGYTPGATPMGGGDTLVGFERAYDSLDRLTSIVGWSGAFAGDPSNPNDPLGKVGASWDWGGRSRLYRMSVNGPVGATVRYSYLGDRTNQGQEAVGAASRWKLGTMTYGSELDLLPASDGEPPEVIWDQMAFGWRDSDGHHDGAKIGRKVLGKGAGILAGMGWSWGLDNALRLTSAFSGTGSLEEHDPTGSIEEFTYSYSEGDELEWMSSTSQGRSDFEAGAYGRIESRDGIAFEYDSSGRRIKDDRYEYRWDWRDLLREVNVIDESHPYSGDQVRYEYDALGRLLQRTHLGKLDDTGERSFIERRSFIWDGPTLLSEVGFGDPTNDNAIRWRKTYVPGPTGLDDAVQVLVEIFNEDTLYPSTLYTYIRDEMGTVIGIVEESDEADPSKPPLVARYTYSPYGEAHVETEPELLKVEFLGDITSIETEAGIIEQVIEDSELAAAGVLSITMSLPLDTVSLAEGFLVYRKNSVDDELQYVDSDDYIISIDKKNPARIIILLPKGWARGFDYRVNSSNSMKDYLTRYFNEAIDVAGTIPLCTKEIIETSSYCTASVSQTITFNSHNTPFESTKHNSILTCGNAISGRFPGGQSILYQGHWSDPVSGLSYARNRWLDVNTASWLSSDPALSVDSSNLYAFVGWSPHRYLDSMGRRRYYIDETSESLSDSQSNILNLGINEWLRSQDWGPGMNRYKNKILRLRNRYKDFSNTNLQLISFVLVDPPVPIRFTLANDYFASTKVRNPPVTSFDNKIGFKFILGGWELLPSSDTEKKINQQIQRARLAQMIIGITYLRAISSDPKIENHKLDWGDEYVCRAVQLGTKFIIERFRDFDFGSQKYDVLKSLIESIAINQSDTNQGLKEVSNLIPYIEKHTGIKIEIKGPLPTKKFVEGYIVKYDANGEKYLEKDTYFVDIEPQIFEINGQQYTRRYTRITLDGNKFDIATHELKGEEKN
jgi:RHS repeat-associated protein